MDGPYHLCHLFTPPLEANQVKPSHGLHLSNRDIWKKQGCLHHHTTQAWPFDTTWEVNLTYVVGIWNRMEGKGTHWLVSEKSSKWTTMDKTGRQENNRNGTLWFDTLSIYPSKGHHLLEKEGELHRQSKQVHQASPLVKAGVGRQIRLHVAFSRICGHSNCFSSNLSPFLVHSLA